MNESTETETEKPMVNESSIIEYELSDTTSPTKRCLTDCPHNAKIDMLKTYPSTIKVGSSMCAIRCPLKGFKGHHVANESIICEPELPVV